MSTKQVIVMIRKFPDGKGGFLSPRLGKMVAQGGHAVAAFLTRRIQQVVLEKRSPEAFMKNGHFDLLRYLNITSEMWEWMQSSYAKVCVQVNSEEELLEIYKQAKEAGLETHLVTDSGRTEFSGPTRTCLAIGPDDVTKIDTITGHLKLL